MTTYLTIDSSGVHVNNGYKTAEEDLPWSGNGYKKPFVAEGIFSALFFALLLIVRILPPYIGVITIKTTTEVVVCTRPKRAYYRHNP